MFGAGAAAMPLRKRPVSLPCPNRVLRLPEFFDTEYASDMRRHSLKIALFLVLAACVARPTISAAQVESAPLPPQSISNRVAVFSGLDKISGRTITFDVYIDETVRFGQLQITPRVCHTRPATETPKTTAFVEVDEETLDRQIRRIFTGWIFADSPGLNAIEHPIFDIWLKDCKMESDEVSPPS